MRNENNFVDNIIAVLLVSGMVISTGYLVIASVIEVLR